jgi:uncharacterized protein
MTRATPKMRRLLYCALLCCLPCAAAELSPYEEWRAFREEFREFAAGPTGIYSAQDMCELNPGESAHLASSEDPGMLRWQKSTTAATLVTVGYRSGELVVSGPGIAQANLLQLKDRQLTLPNGLIVKASVFHGQTWKIWLYDPALPAKRGFKGLTYFPYDSRGVVTGEFHPHAAPSPMTYLDSRGDHGTMYWVGTLDVQIAGKPHALRALSYDSVWSEIDTLLVLLKDRTSGKTTYGGGRVIDIHIPLGAPPRTVRLNLNTAYSFLCAHSEFYNCPLALATRVDAELNYGEKYPPL